MILHICVSLFLLASIAASACGQAAPARSVTLLPLGDVRITGGPLKVAQDLDRDYLLALDPERLLVGYRLRAGLETTAQGYGGWDDVHSRQLTGHAAGHYLSAVSLMYAATGDARFRERAEQLVAGLKEVQDAQGDGYVGALLGTRQVKSTDSNTTSEELVDGKILLGLLAKGEINSSGFDLNGLWAPWYTLHKTFAGLRDAYRHTGNETALKIEVRFAEWVASIVDPLDDRQFQQMLGTEFGGINEVMADLYADTRDERWLALSRRFEHQAILAPLKQGVDDLNGKHGNTQVPKLIGSAARYAYAGDATDLAAARFFWDRVAHHHSFATGGHGKDEYFGRPDELSDRIDGRTAESCNIYNMLKLTRQLFEWNPNPAYAEFHERALLNHVLGSIDPQSGSTCYMVPVGMGVEREYQDMYQSFTCCVGTGMESHALHGHGLYYERADELWITQFVPSVAHWKQQRARLTTETEFPLGDAATIKLQLPEPKTLTLHVRRPAWAGEGFGIRINGEAVSDLAAAGSFVAIEREWHDGDTIAVDLPKTLQLAPLPDNPHRAAILWGPLVLAAPLETSGDESKRQVPSIVTGDTDPAQWLVPVDGEPGHFTTRGVGRPGEFHLRPFYTLHRRVYSAHWDIYTPDEWQQVERAIAAERNRLAELESRTVSFVQPGEMQPERDFAFAGEETWPVREADRAGRIGRDWFEFTMPVAANTTQQLVLTLRTASRVGQSRFRILIGDQPPVEFQLDATSPARFEDVAFPIADSVVKDKTSVTVRFEAVRPGHIGPLFGIRITKADVAE